MIALNNQINAARDVTKTHTSSVETFKSGDFGPGQFAERIEPLEQKQLF
jgi:L-asparaginase/Glu-tRNA(Gln) amidotransferase subunit D